MASNKTAFLILRVSEAFKNKIIKKAKGKNVSKYIRSILEKVI